MSQPDPVLIESQRWTALLANKHIVVHTDKRGFTVSCSRRGERPQTGHVEGRNDESKDYVAGDNLPESLRILFPDSITTRDYRVERLNVLVGYDGVVTSAYMG
ncbi:hypothetical protein NADFUDRAFT_44080 [Nadsonia fulvescens var. elongata DSM 6958]|uniref:Uncharacterized protein n=1 Tax=Nadsonia fulvescens var. elongata DSM 6958 TaxID=857566 RepID=A0A1E3PCM5_9ASCO|nr:hypothetical protein NADFUDRAFT_44080 [Nadsonia fulvescens var. elongata DSM 6958]